MARHSTHAAAWLRRIFLAILVCWAPVVAGASTTARVNGWTVRFGDALNIEAVQAGNRTLLTRFDWLMQGRRDGKIRHLASQAAQQDIETNRKASSDGPVVSMPAATVSDMFEWRASIDFHSDSFRVHYHFRFLRDVPESWILIQCRVPDSETMHTSGVGDKNGSSAGDTAAISYETPHGPVTFSYKTDSVLLSPHRPYLKPGLRLHLGKPEPGTRHPRRFFRAGETFNVTVHTRLPEAPNPKAGKLSLSDQVNIGLATGGRPYWLYVPGDEVKVEIPVKTVPGRGRKVTAEWILTDYWSQPVWCKRRRVDLETAGREPLALTFPAPGRFGPYRLTLQLRRTLPEGITQMVAKDVAVLGVRNPDWMKSRVPVEEAFLGAIIHGGFENRELARKFGIRWKRCDFEVMWTWHSPKPGTYTFKKEPIQWLEELDMIGYGQMAYSPPWAVEATPREREKVRSQKRSLHHFLSSRPPRPEAFRSYVRNVVPFFKDDLTYWELWNEPNVPMFWNGSPGQYLELLKIAAAEMERIDPDAKLLGPSGGGMVGLDPWGQALLELGAAPYFDIWSVHHYAQDTYFDVESMHSQLRTLRATLDENGGKHLEVWNTEGGSRTESLFRDAEFDGWPSASERTPPAVERGYSLPKLFAVERAEGVRKHFLYFVKSIPEYSSLAFLEKTGAPRFSLYPAAACNHLLEGADFVERWTQGQLGFAYFFQRQDTAVAMIWADLPRNESVVLSLKSAPGLQLFDVLGNVERRGASGISVSIAPVYLEWRDHDVDAMQNILEWDALPPLKNPQLLAERTQPPGLDLPQIADFNVAKEVGTGNLTPLDISPYCNRGFVDEAAGDHRGGWSDEGPFNDFHGVRVGRRMDYGVPYVLVDPAANNGKSVMTLRSETTPNGIGRVTLPVNDGMRGLFVIHASQNYTRPGLAYSLAIQYRDGTRETLRVPVPQRLNSTWHKPDPEVEERHHTKTIPMRVSAEKRKMRKWEKEWARKGDRDYIYRYPRMTYFENPAPQAGEVKSIEIVSASPHGVPIIMAITLAGR